MSGLRGIQGAPSSRVPRALNSRSRPGGSRPPGRPHLQASACRALNRGDSPPPPPSHAAPEAPAPAAATPRPDPTFPAAAPACGDPARRQLESPNRWPCPSAAPQSTVSSSAAEFSCGVPLHCEVRPRCCGLPLGQAGVEGAGLASVGRDSPTSVPGRGKNEKRLTCHLQLRCPETCVGRYCPCKQTEWQAAGEEKNPPAAGISYLLAPGLWTGRKEWVSSNRQFKLRPASEDPGLALDGGS